MASRRTPGQEKAQSYLARLIDEQRQTVPLRLPGIVRLAAAAGVAPATMWKAVRTLASSGRVSTRRGARSIVTPSAQEQPGTAPTAARLARPSDAVCRWERLKCQVEQDILRGVYRPGAVMPSRKELVAAYGACHRTVRKALDALVSQGALAVWKKTHRVPLLSSNRHGAAVALVALGYDAARLIPYSSRTLEHLRLLEISCTRSGLALRTALCSHLTGRLHDPDTLSPGRSDGDSLLGSLVWTVGMRSGVLAAVLQQLAALAGPVALLDETGEIPMLPLQRGNRLLRAFTLGVSARAGEQVGRWLLSLGHRRIAYISTTHGALWSRNRLQGLRDAYAAAGIPDGVVPFTLDRFDDAWEAVEQERPMHARIDALFARDLKRSRTAPALYRRVLEALRSRLNETMVPEMLQEQLAPLLERVCAERGVTAWAAANDTMGCACLRYLARHGTDVPRDLSVVGFDDSLEASQQRLTSYNANLDALVQAMLGHVLAPLRRRDWSAESPAAEIEGFVNVRATTAQAAVAG